MEVKFELTIDNLCNPIIKFRHYDKDNSLEQKLLGTFINGIKAHGLKLTNPNVYLKSGTNESWDNYEVHINKNEFKPKQDIDPITKLSTTTPYTVDEILNFIKLSGASIKETEHFMADFCRGGLQIDAVMMLLKMGYLDLNKK